MKVNETLTTLLEKVKGIANTENVVGEPIVVKDVTLIPISKVQIGFAAGGGDNDKDAAKKGGGGAGGGVSVTPIAVIVVRDGQEARLLWLNKEEKSLNKILDMIPNVMDRVLPDKK